MHVSSRKERETCPRSRSRESRLGWSYRRTYISNSGSRSQRKERPWRPLLGGSSRSGYAGGKGLANDRKTYLGGAARHKTGCAWSVAGGSRDIRRGDRFRCGAVAGNELAVTLAANFDSVPQAVYRGHAFVPVDWMAREYPQTAGGLRFVERRVREAAEGGFR